jgi:hypothetical protein
MLQARERALTPSSFVVFIFGFAVGSIKELWGASGGTNTKHIPTITHAFLNRPSSEDSLNWGPSPNHHKATLVAT